MKEATAIQIPDTERIFRGNTNKLKTLMNRKNFLKDTM